MEQHALWPHVHYSKTTLLPIHTKGIIYYRTAPLCISTAREPDSKAHPEELSQLQQAEEDPLASGDPPADQALWPSAGTWADSSIGHAEWTVFVISK